MRVARCSSATIASTSSCQSRSNPWVAGIATLYTPEFFPDRPLAPDEDGVFCQWVQLYQLPLPVVAGIVRNVQEVFPHVEVWFGESAGSHGRRFRAAANVRLDVGGSARRSERSHRRAGARWLNVTAPTSTSGGAMIGERASSPMAPLGPTSRATHVESYVSGRPEATTMRSCDSPNHTSTCGNTSCTFRTIRRLQAGAAGTAGPTDRRRRPRSGASGRSGKLGRVQGGDTRDPRIGRL